MSADTAKPKEILLARGLKPTFQRIRILEYLQKHNGHPTVEEIHEELIQEIPTISKTTIYNTMDALLEKGIIHAVTITGTETRYDCQSLWHHHFLCRRCGRVIDIDLQCPYLKEKQIEGHLIEELHGYLKGVCKECLKTKRKTGR